MSPNWRDIWLKADAVCFDVDSTVSCDEGIDLLAAICGAGEEVAAWTNKAMAGNTTFEQALAARLDIIKPRLSDLQACMKQHPPALTPHVEELIAYLHKRGSTVYLVSGGFKQMIEPIAAQLHIPHSHIFANQLRFNEAGDFAGYNAEAFTACSGGKQLALNWIKSTYQHRYMVMIGDGITDLEARPPADLFIAYTGIKERPSVVEAADYVCSDFSQLLALHEQK